MTLRVAFLHAARRDFEDAAVGTKNGGRASAPNFEPRWMLRWLSQQSNPCAFRENTRASVVYVCGVFPIRCSSSRRNRVSLGLRRNVNVPMETRTNLRVLKRSRTPPKRGDIFVMQLSDGSYLFGRAILTDAPQEHAPMPGANLLYIYNARARTPNPHYAVLRPGRLLIPPVWTNRLAWTKG